MKTEQVERGTTQARSCAEFASQMDDLTKVFTQEATNMDTETKTANSSLFMECFNSLFDLSDLQSRDRARQIFVHADTLAESLIHLMVLACGVFDARKRGDAVRCDQTQAQLRQRAHELVNVQQLSHKRKVA